MYLYVAACAICASRKSGVGGQQKAEPHQGGSSRVTETTRAEGGSTTVEATEERGPTTTYNATYTVYYRSYLLPPSHQGGHLRKREGEQARLCVLFVWAGGRVLC